MSPGALMSISPARPGFGICQKEKKLPCLSRGQIDNLFAAFVFLVWHIIKFQRPRAKASSDPDDKWAGVNSI